MKKPSKILSLCLCAVLLLTSCAERTNETLSYEEASEETTAQVTVFSDTEEITAPSEQEANSFLQLKEEPVGEYGDKVYTLTNISDETVDNVREKLRLYPEFSDITKMTISYPSDCFEVVEWNNGEPDLENSEQFFDALNSNSSNVPDSLEPGESWTICIPSEEEDYITEVVTDVPKTTEPKVTKISEITTTAPKTTTPVTTTEEKYKPTEAEYKAVMPSDSIIKEAVKLAVSGEEVYIALYENGSYEIVDKNEMYDANILESIEKMLSRECYEELLSLYGEDTDSPAAAGLGSYEEYREMIFSMVGDTGEYEKYFDENGKLIKEATPYFYFRYGYVGNGGEGFVSDEEAAEAGLRWLFGLRAEDSGLEPLIKYVFRQGVTDGIYAGCEYGGKGTAKARTYYYSHSIDFDAEETLTFETEGGIFLCDVFVPSDTKKLFITSRGQWAAQLLVDFLPEDCLWVCDNGDENSEPFTFDLKEINKALPELTELYMYQTLAANPDSIGDMKNLTALSYYAIDEVIDGFPARTDTPFISLKKLNKLRLYGEYTDYSFLSEMDSLRDVFVRVKNAESAESLFKNKCVTGIEFECSGFETKGIENLTNLKYLDISSYADMKDIAKVTSLTELNIKDNSGADLSLLSGLKNLEALSIHRIHYTDWSFLRELKKLKKLSLNYTNTNDDDIKGLNVTELLLNNTENHHSVISEMPKLRIVSVTELNSSIDDFKGSDALESYCELFGKSGDYSKLALCPNLETISLGGCKGTFDAADFVGMKKLKEIFLNGTEILSGEKLGNIKTLKSIEIYSDSVDAALGDKLKKLLPDCSITVENDQFFQ